MPITLEERIALVCCPTDVSAEYGFVQTAVRREFLKLVQVPEGTEATIANLLNTDQSLSSKLESARIETELMPMHQAAAHLIGELLRIADNSGQLEPISVAE